MENHLTITSLILKTSKDSSLLVIINLSSNEQEKILAEKGLARGLSKRVFFLKKAEGAIPKSASLSSHMMQKI